MKAFAKVNIFLKITGIRGNYHEIASRFVIIENLYDELSFTKNETDDFFIEGNFDCETKQNTIYKAYIALNEAVNSKKLKDFFKHYGIKVKKNIPAFAGLGGGSSNAAVFLLMCNDELKLGLKKEELSYIGSKAGADVPFFVYGYKSANVSGIGEKVEEFKEESLNIETFTPDIKISTPTVYKTYREFFFNPIYEDEKNKLFKTNSKDILKNSDIYGANDLYAPALKLYPDLKKFQKKGWYFSGSGSSFFRII